ncbi:hypothetical protein ACR31S_02450 [Streptococcus iniae]
MLLIKNGRVIDPKSGFYGVRDIYIREGNIIEISEDIQAIGVEEIDARGLMVSPNLTAISISGKEKCQPWMRSYPLAYIWWQRGIYR